jgi:hypothetical protein
MKTIPSGAGGVLSAVVGSAARVGAVSLGVVRVGAPALGAQPVNTSTGNSGKISRREALIAVVLSANLTDSRIIAYSGNAEKKERRKREREDESTIRA